MTTLEKRLIEDMKRVGYSERTQDTYLYAVRKLTNHFQTSPDKITNEQLRAYLLWHKDKYAPNTTTIALCGIKFFYQKILKKPMPVFDLARHPKWVFPAPSRSGSREPEASRPLPISSLQKVFRQSLKEVGIQKEAHAGTLRPSYATHLLEEGIDIRIISEYLGHKSLESTLIYTHLTPLLKQGVADKIHRVMSDLQ